LPTGCGHTSDEPVETSAEETLRGLFRPRTQLEGVVFVIEFAVCGVFRREGVAGRGVKPGIESTAR